MDQIEIKEKANAVMRREISNLSLSKDLPFQVLEFNTDEQYVIVRLHLSPNSMHYNDENPYFDIRFSYPNRYPIKAATVQFIGARIPYHPQVDDDGNMTMTAFLPDPLINSRLQRVLLHIWVMLDDPLFIPCGDESQKKLFQNDPDQFRRRVARISYQKQLFLEAMRRLHPSGDATLTAPPDGQDQDPLIATVGKIISLPDCIARQLWDLTAVDRFSIRYATTKYKELQLYLCCARVLDRYRDHHETILSVLEELREQIPFSVYGSLITRYT